MKPPTSSRGMRESSLPMAAVLACRKLGVLPARFFLHVKAATQTATLFGRDFFPDPMLQHVVLSCPPAKTTVSWKYRVLEQFRCSTSKFGIGQIAGSNCTPLGLHRIAEKIGGGWPVGTVFQGRQPVGFTWQGMPLASITTRILWLEGLEPGFNQGGLVDSRARYIYIHGTGDEPSLGRPTSHGCIHLAAADLIPLYDKLPVGTLVWISEH